MDSWSIGSTNDWADLPPAERAWRCRLLAEEAQKLAAGASVELADGYLKIAADWLKLADDLDRAANPSIDPPTP